MKLNRLLLQSLKQWANQAHRLPLLLRGARQTGKTWLLQELGRECFEHTAYFDFASRPALQEIFSSTRDPQTILKGLNLLSEVPILPGKTLIVFDEIQLCDHAFGSLKYFAQNAPEYAVAASGSLLGIEVRRKQIFVPVGQVDIRDVWPLSFSEFLFNASPKLYDYVEQISEITQLPTFVLNEIESEFIRYQCIGGMQWLPSWTAKRCGALSRRFGTSWQCIDSISRSTPLQRRQCELLPYGTLYRVSWLNPTHDSS